jgi:pilus assembly protein CpaB
MATPKTTATVITVAALLLASVAAYLVYNFLSAKQKEAAENKVNMQPVVVAANQIPFGATIEPAQLKVQDWPKNNLPVGYKANPKEIEGRLAVVNIPANSPVLESSLAPAQPGAGMLSFLVPEGHRAVTVAVNEVVGVAGFVLPNSIVDVVATVTPPYGSNTRVSKIVLQNIKVLATGQILEQKEGKPVTSPTVTLDVTPEQAEKLIIASENRVQLILKHLGDNQEVKTPGATVVSLLGGSVPVVKSGRPAARRASARAAERPQPVPGVKVEVIRGNAKSTQEFK